MYYLEKVNFTTSFGEDVSFDEKGDVLPTRGIVNWVWLPGGSTEVHIVGVYKKSGEGEELVLDEDRIVWNVEYSKVTCSQLFNPMNVFLVWTGIDDFYFPL